MPTLEELLQTTLKGVTEQYDKASGDLHRAVTELALAVKSITKGAASLLIRDVEIDEVVDDTVYELSYVPHRGEPRGLGLFLIPSKGYPIRLYSHRGDLYKGASVRSFQSEDEIKQFFQKMVKDQTSPLISLLAYTLRTNQVGGRTQLPSNNQTEGEDVAF